MTSLQYLNSLIILLLIIFNLLATFGAITLSVYNLLRNDLIHASMKFKG